MKIDDSKRQLRSDIYLTFVNDAGVEAVLETVTRKRYILRERRVEGVVREVCAVQLPREVWVVDIVLLGDACQLGSGFRPVARRIRRIRRCRLRHTTNLKVTGNKGN